MEEEDIIEESVMSDEEFMEKVEANAKRYLQKEDKYNSAVCFRLLAELKLKISKKPKIAIDTYKFAGDLFNAINKMDDAEICYKRIEEIQIGK